MSETTKYIFKIKGFTPRSMPFDRLLSYYHEVKEMIGHADCVHLIEVSDSSHATAFELSSRYEAEVNQRMEQVSEGTASFRVNNAYRKINAMLEEDKTSATFFGETTSNVTQFPGEGVPRPYLYKVREAASFTGQLYYIAGAEDGANVRIRTEAYGAVFCTTTLKLAKEFREFLFENVKVNGRGLWTRSEAGEWDIDNFIITDFAPSGEEDLRSAVDRLRALEIQWPDDPVSEIYKLNENGS